MKQLLITIAAVVLVGCGPSVDIHQAAQEGNIEAVKQAIANGVDVNAKNNDGWTALHMAARFGQKEIGELLIAEGADVNAKNNYGWTALYIAASNYRGNKEVVELLISEGADVNAKDDRGRAPLHGAAFDGHKEVVELLISEGADVNAKDDRGGTPLDAAEEEEKRNWTLLGSAFEEKMNEVANLLRKHGGKYGFIHTAAVGGDTEAVKEFLAAGADVNAKDNDGYTALHLAVGKRGSLEVVKLLITEGVDVNVKNKGGATPLHFTAFYGQEDVTKLLIDNGVDVNMKGLTGETPLDWAMRGKNGINANRFHTEIIDLLRKHGGKMSEELDAAEQGSKSEAPDITIHDAAAKGNLEAVKHHLAAGMNVNTQDDSGRTPLHWAVYQNHKEIVGLLIANSADVNARFGVEQFTPLFAAAINDNKEIAEFLITNGADVNEKYQNNINPLLIAAIRDSRTVVELLIAEGANLNSKNAEGETALHCAAYQNHKEISQLLLAKDADVNAKNERGETPLDYATKPEYATLLRKHGGKTSEELKAEGK